LDVMTKAFQEDNGGHLVFTLRFVTNDERQHNGHLAFTRFPETAVINVDGIRSAKSSAAGARIARALADNKVAFSQHWGKMGEITCEHIEDQFGPSSVASSRLAKWKTARAALLDSDIQNIFQNKALRNWCLV